MIEKRLLRPDRARNIVGSFAAIEHRSLREGFWAELSHHELILYPFLVLVGDRHGLTYCDELGYLSLGSQGSNLFFQVISQRHTQRSTIFSTNLPFAQWGKVFDSNTVASAIADRGGHHPRQDGRRMPIKLKPHMGR